MIYTGYYANYKFYVNQGLTPIAISGKAPSWYKGLWWKDLAPSWSIWKQWDKKHDENIYTDRFFKEIISNLDIQTIKQRLANLENPILLCYEKDGFCHRHLISDWLNHNGIDCKEYK